MNTPKTIQGALRAARQLLSDRKAWTKGDLAKTAGGRMTSITAPHACKFCMLGAVYRVCGGTGKLLAVDTVAALDTLARITGRPSAVNFNDADGTKHEDVLAFLDLGIQVARYAEA